MAGQYHNVIIFGAGASVDAGIPAMAGFIDKMWEYGFRGKNQNTKLSESDLDLFRKANEIRYELENYNSRAFFDSRNLEDILSLLSFEALSGEKQIQRYEDFVKAVARTIELSCSLAHVDGVPEKPFNHNTIYHQFWRHLLAMMNGINMPALISFNYDLVLERSLWEFFHYPDSSASKPTVKSCGIKYYFGKNNFSIKNVKHDYRFAEQHHPQIVSHVGMKGVFSQDISDAGTEKAEVEIPYFKLHGSLNWSQEFPNGSPRTFPTAVVDKPLILPPVFNKMNKGEINTVWKEALDVLRSATNIIIVGYSLPRTDIYMQYFLKSAVGPNSNLHKIIVFDPVLFEKSTRTEEMKRRFSECFSPQFSSRIEFTPSPYFNSSSGLLGKFTHFLNILQSDMKSLFFNP